MEAGSEIDELYQQNVREHRAILDAIRARSATGARALAREHVLASCHLLEVILEQVGAQPRDLGRSAAG